MIGGRNLHSSVMSSFGSGTSNQKQPAVSTANRTSLHKIISSSRQATPTITTHATGSLSQPRQPGTIIIGKRQPSKDKNEHKNQDKPGLGQQLKLVGKSSDTAMSAAANSSSSSSQQVKQSTQHLQLLLARGKETIEKTAKREDMPPSSSSFSPIPKYCTPQPKQYQPKTITATIVPNYMPHAQQAAQMKQSQEVKLQGQLNKQQQFNTTNNAQIADAANNSPVEIYQINTQNAAISNGAIKLDSKFSSPNNFQQSSPAISSTNVGSSKQIPLLKGNLQQFSNQQIKGLAQNESKSNTTNDLPEGSSSPSIFSKTKYIDLQQFATNPKKQSSDSPQPYSAPQQQQQQQHQQIILSVTSYAPSSVSFSSQSSKVQHKTKIPANIISIEKERKEDLQLDASRDPPQLPSTTHTKQAPEVDYKSPDLFPARDYINKGEANSYLSSPISQQQSYRLSPNETNQNNPPKTQYEAQQNVIQRINPHNQLQNTYELPNKEQEQGNQQTTTFYQHTQEKQFQNSKNLPQLPPTSQQFQQPQYQIPQVSPDGKYQQSSNPLQNSEFTSFQHIPHTSSKPNQPASQFTQQSIEAYQLGDWEEGVKRRKLCVFSERVQNAKNEFENVLREFNENSSQTMSEYHQNIQFLETSENVLKTTMNEVTSNLKSILLETFNHSLSRSKTGQFEVQQILTYLNSTENDLMSNIEGIVKDMDISSLDDIINQYEQVISQYERILQENISKITYSSYQVDNLQAKSAQIQVLAQHMKSQFQDIIALQPYTANILGQRQNPSQNMNNSKGKQVWNSSQFGQINEKITGNATQLQRSLLQDTGDFKPSNFEVDDSQLQQQYQPKSIYVSFENKDVFTNAVANSSLKEPTIAGTDDNNNNSMYPQRQLINFQRQDSYPQPQSPSFQSPFLGAQQPSKDKSEELNSLIQHNQESGISNLLDQNIQINKQKGDGSSNNNNNSSNNFIANMHGKQPIVNLNLTSPQKIPNQLSNQAHVTSILPLSPSHKNHSYKFSGGSISGVNPSGTTTANTLTEAQTSTSSRAQSEKIKGISDLYDHLGAEAKANRRMLSNQEQQRSLDVPFSTSLWNSAEHRSNIKFPEEDGLLDKQTGQSNIAPTAAHGVFIQQISQNHSGIPFQQTPMFSHEDFEKSQDQNNNFPTLAKKQHKYNELLQKIQVNQSHTEKLYSDVLQNQGAAFKFSLLEDGIPLRSSAQCVSLANHNNNKS